MLFAVPRELSIAHFGHPVDVVIDNRDRWYILYSSGKIVVLKPDLGFEKVICDEDGLPASSRKLLHLPLTDDILVGTASDGVYLLRSN